MPHNKPDSILGCLLGSAVGDALGLPFEGLSARRRERMFGRIDRYHLVFGRGMVSDDTEHACMTAQSLIECNGDPDRFSRALAWRLRWWVLMIPAGVGFATLRACGKLWFGFPPERSGVYSAGNGPAMRAPVIGATFGTNDDWLWPFIEACTRITHRDRKAFCGAFAAGWAAAWASEQRDFEPFADSLAEKMADEPDADPLIERIRDAWRSANDGESTRAFAASLGLEKGVTGYIYDTVPVAIHAWFRHPGDFSRAVCGVIECGGDADTTGAITGAIVGAQVGASNIPSEFLDGFVEWPRSVDWIRTLADALSRQQENYGEATAPRLSAMFILPRNILFAAIVLAHGFRRLAPPY